MKGGERKMRKGKEGILLILVTALIFALTSPVAMAANNTSQSTDMDYSNHGMSLWIDGFDMDAGTSGIQLEGQGAYGYYTGFNPGFNNVGLGLIDEDDVNHALGAPSYTSPCPTFVDSNGSTAPGGCEANIDSDEPQTAPLETVWEIPILDDMLAKMWDFAAENDRLTQTLDILFYLDPKTTDPAKKVGFIDQTLDQDLADYTGSITSYVHSNGVGHVQRLVQLFQLMDTVSKANPGHISENTGDDADYIDQWVLSYTKDIEGSAGTKVGIVSSYSGWFSLDKNEISCPDCVYTYPTGHTLVEKFVPEVDGHPNDDIPDP